MFICKMPTYKTPSTFFWPPLDGVQALIKEVTPPSSSIICTLTLFSKELCKSADVWEQIWQLQRKGLNKRALFSANNNYKATANAIPLFLFPEPIFLVVLVSPSTGSRQWFGCGGGGEEISRCLFFAVLVCLSSEAPQSHPFLNDHSPHSAATSTWLFPPVFDQSPPTHTQLPMCELLPHSPPKPLRSPRESPLGGIAVFVQ